MRLLAALSLALGSLVIAPAPVARANTPVISAVPGSGPAGTQVTVIGADFLHNVPIEIHVGSKTGTLLATGTSTNGGLFGIRVTIPASAAPGVFTLYACGSCASEFFDSATTNFTVTIPATIVTTTTTTPIGDGGDDEPVTHPATTMVTGGGCEIPDTATIIDFDAWDRSLGDSEDPAGDLQQAVLDALHPIHLRMWDAYEIRFDPADDTHPNVLYAPRTDSIAFVTDDPAGNLSTTSPPNVLRLVGDTHWTVQAGWGQLRGQLDYFGFVVGFGHFPDGFTVLAGEDAIEVREGWDHFDTPDQVVVELTVRTMPLEYVDARVLDQGAWETVTVTLGPGPQPVTHCLVATNTLGELDPKTVYVVDILVRGVDGEPLDIAVDIDDVFYGYHGVGAQMPALEFVDEPSAARPVGTVGAAPGAAGADTPSDEQSPWLVAGLVLAGVVVGGVVMWGVRRRPSS